jgi:hypothetical protein
MGDHMMKNRCKTYTSEQISRFVDKELPKNEYDILERHLHQCSACRHLVEQYNTLSVLYTSHIEQQVNNIDTSKVSQKVDRVIEQGTRFSNRNALGLIKHSFFGLFKSNTFKLFKSNTFEQFKSNTFEQFKSNTFELFNQNIYLKLASITAILMISLFSFQNTWFGTPGPSAIVNSVDTDFASVMIIETQKEKHTIIWFSET